jgi:hypothetical protein
VLMRSSIPGPSTNGEERNERSEEERLLESMLWWCFPKCSTGRLNHQIFVYSYHCQIWTKAKIHLLKCKYYQCSILMDMHRRNIALSKKVRCHGFQVSRSKESSSCLRLFVLTLHQRGEASHAKHNVIAVTCILPPTHAHQPYTHAMPSHCDPTSSQVNGTDISGPQASGATRCVVWRFFLLFRVLIFPLALR